MGIFIASLLLLTKSLLMKTFLSLFIIFLTVFFISCNKDDDGDYTVKYRISSSNAMNVTYTDADGSLKTANNVTSSWTYSFKTPGNGRLFKLIINSINGSAVSGFIYVNGQEASQDDSNTGSVTVTTQVP